MGKEENKRTNEGGKEIERGEREKEREKSGGTRHKSVNEKVRLKIGRTA